jgi:hypothetical protein
VRDWAATVQEAVRVLAEPVWAVTVELALVQSRVMSNGVDQSPPPILVSTPKKTITRFLDFARNDKLLEPLAVNLINTNKASDKVPIFLIREAASVRGPGKLARRFWMIGVVDEIAFNSGIRRKRFLLIS